MTRIVLCDTFPILLSGLGETLRDAHDLTVVATCATGAEALRIVRTEDPDILITDLWLSDMSGLEVTQTIVGERRHTRVILLATTLSAAEAVKALRHGVRGIITMEMPPLQILTCVRSVHAGHTWLDTPIAHGALTQVLRHGSTLGHLKQTLTPREIAISQLVAQGLSNREIADRMGIREGTAKLHLHHVYQKLGIGNRIALVHHAREHALA